MNEWLKKIAAFFKGNPNATEEEAIKSVGEPPKDPPSTQQPINIAGLAPEAVRLIEELRASNNAATEQIKQLTNSLAEEKKAREDSLKTTQAEQEKLRVQKRDEWIVKHTEAGRIAPKNEEDKKYWTELYDTLGADKAETAISKINGSPKQEQKPTGAQGQGAQGSPTQKSREELMNEATAELSKLL